MIWREFQLLTHYRVDRAPRCYVTITARCIWNYTHVCMPKQNLQFRLKISDATTLNITYRPTSWPKFVHSCTTQSNLGNRINSNQNIATDSLISHTRHYDCNIYRFQCWIPIRPVIQLNRFLTVRNRPCWCCNETSCIHTIQCGEFLVQLQNYQLLKKLWSMESVNAYGVNSVGNARLRGKSGETRTA